MFSKSGYNDSLKELIKAKKADKSVASVIKENLDIQAYAKSEIKKNEKELKILSVASKDKQNIKTQTSIHNFKEYMSIRKEIRDIKKQIKKMNNDVKAYNKKIEAAEMYNSEIEEEIENQFKIYQQNEIYAKAFQKIDKNIVDIPEESYSSYMQHIEQYNNSIYSIENNSKLPKPKAEDFVGILNALKESEEKQRKIARKKTSSSTTTKRSRKTSTAKAEGKTTNKKV